MKITFALEDFFPVDVAYAWLAQSVEHETLNLRVVGSSPTLGVLKVHYRDKNRKY